MTTKHTQHEPVAVSHKIWFDHNPTHILQSQRPTHRQNKHAHTQNIRPDQKCRVHFKIVARISEVVTFLSAIPPSKISVSSLTTCSVFPLSSLALVGWMPTVL